MDANLPLVTVVVPMLNEERFIGECLDSLIDQDYPSDRLEVLVVDGRSEDRSHSIVQGKSREHGFIRLLDNPKRSAPAALNAGIRAAQGQVIAIVGAHSSVDADFVRQNVRKLVETDAACVGGGIQTVSLSAVGEAIALAMACPFGVGDAMFRYSEKEQYVDTVAFAAYRREVFDQIGLFDEELIGAEDDELNYRLRAHGGRILLSPQIRSRYVCRSSVPTLWKQYFRYGEAKVRVLQRHPRQMRWRQFVPPAFVTAVAAGLALATSGILWPLAVVAGAYLAASLGVSIYLASRTSLRHLAILPLAFATLHVAYGTGFLKGLADSAGRWCGRQFVGPAVAE
jgi:cellulose synthase/poly-beta-1,6-N-acetylglucosamine synthase-like glycosyltransferase